MTFAYVAGFLDGEGHLSIRPKHRCFVVGMTQSVRTTDVLGEIQTFLLRYGITSQITPPRTQEGRRPVQHLRVTNAKSIARLLTRCLPYLIVKRERAIEALEIAEDILDLQAARDGLVNAAIADYQAGMSMNAVARKYGTSRQRLIPHLKKRGIRIRTLQEAQRLFLQTAPPKYFEQRRQAAAKGNIVRWKKHGRRHK